MTTPPENEKPRPRPRPEPQYGEYAPPGWVSPNAADLPAPVPPPGEALIEHPTPKPRAWDRPLSIALLVVGFFGMSFGLYGGINLQAVLEQAAIMQGVTLTLPAWTAQAGLFVAISHVVLYAIAVGWTLQRLRQNRTAFWVPLGAGIVAAIIYHGITGGLGITSGLVPM